jgi:hypothetical protein
MIEELPSNTRKRAFYTLIFLLLFSIFSVRHFLIPFLSGDKITLDIEVLNKILDDVFTSTLVTIGLGIFILWLTPKNKSNAQFRVLQPIEISPTLENARTDTSKWSYSGGSGRYTRAITLPNLADLARRKNRTIDISIQIMNPHNITVCTNYAEYRNSLRSSKNRKTLKTVQLDLISTIVSAFVWKTEQSLLKIKLGLKDGFSLFRLDISSSNVVITKEDPIEPAMSHEQGTFFYQAYSEDLLQSFNQCRIIDMSIRFYRKDEITVENTKRLLEQLGLMELLTDADIPDIISNVISTKNPYA